MQVRPLPTRLDMKHCNYCDTTKETAEFHFRSKEKGTLQPYCKACRKEWDATRYKENPTYFHSKGKGRRRTQRKWWQEFKKSLKCNRCEENHPAVLDFHHTDPSTKDFTIGEAMTKGYGRERVMKEVAKCEILCSNCHRKEHWNKTYS